MSKPETNDINIGLPNLPTTTDPSLYQELLPLYFAIQQLHRELYAAKQRIVALEAYNTAHP